MDLGVATLIVGFLQIVALIYLAFRAESNTRNILKIEKATNSMKDALVDATGKQNRAEGKAEGRAEQKAEGLV